LSSDGLDSASSYKAKSSELLEVTSLPVDAAAAPAAVAAAAAAAADDDDADDEPATEADDKFVVVEVPDADDAALLGTSGALTGELPLAAVGNDDDDAAWFEASSIEADMALCCLASEPCRTVTRLLMARTRQISHVQTRPDQTNRTNRTN